MKEQDISLLELQNQTLSAELAQCQADKDFVWSLWRKLQTANPDVTEAISLAVNREKELSEKKDRKVLEVLQVKDDRIEELQNMIAKQSEEISDILSRKVDLSEKSSQQHSEIGRLQELVSSLQAQIQSEEKKFRNMEEAFKKSVEDSEKDKYALNREITRLTAQLEEVKVEKVKTVGRHQVLEDRIRNLEKEISDKMVTFEALVQEVDDSSSRLTRYESQTSQQRRELSFKNQELENVRRELKELWVTHNQLIDHSGQQADVIRQLQSLQKDTQTMLRNQEDAFSLESSSLQQMFADVSERYEASKRTEAELRQQILELSKSLMDKDDLISCLKSEHSSYLGHQSSYLDHQSYSRQDQDLPSDYDNSFLDMVKEVDLIKKSGRPNSKTRGRSLNRFLDLDQKRSQDLEVARSRSWSPPTRDVDLSLEPTDVRRVAQLEKSLNLKTNQLETMRAAHDRRLQRFQTLQNNYRLTREQMKGLEFSRVGRHKKPHRADPRSLQKENSDQVWNELTYFKTENRILQVDKVSLQEEVDLLKVQASQDTARVHELKVENQTLKGEYEFQTRSLQRNSRNSKEKEKQLAFLKTQNYNQTVHIDRLEREMTTVMCQRDDLLQEKSTLMSQLSTTQKEASRYQMELADTRHQLQSLRHNYNDLQLQYQNCLEADRRFQENTQHLRTAATRLLARKFKTKKSHISKHNISNQNHSTDEVSECDNSPEADWEEMSDCDSSESELSPVTGRRPGRGHRVMGVNLADMDYRRMKVKHKVSTHRPSSLRQPGHVTGRNHLKLFGGAHHTDTQAGSREFATSPIMFIQPTSNAPSAPHHKPTSPHDASTTTPGGSTTRTAESRHVAATRTAEGRYVTALRHRILRLQRQVAVLKKAKILSVHTEEARKEEIAKLQTELSSVQGRLRAARQQIQKLEKDLETQQHRDKQDSDGGTLPADGRTASPGDGGQVKLLDAKLKTALSDAFKHAAACKMLKSENESLQGQVKSLQDRINHLERDVTQKRNLLESQKLKLKSSQEVHQTDTNNLEELETKNKLLTEASHKMKVQLDSVKQRLSVVSRERREYEEKLIKGTLELEQKSRQLLDVSSQKNNLESALADLESSAQQQLHNLASQSEAAIDAARDKMAATQIRLTRFNSLVKILASELVSRVEQARSKLKEAKESKERSQRDNSLQWAQDKAKDILNLSQSDLDDIMSADGDRESQKSITGEETKSDKRWLHKCDRILNSKESFVQPLVTLLLQKVDERADVLMQLPHPTGSR